MANNFNNPDMKNDMKDAAHDVRKGAENVAADAKQAFNNAASNAGAAADKARSAVNDAADTVKAKASDAIDAAREKGADIADTVRHEANRLYRAGERKAGEVADYAGDYYDEMSDMVRRQPAAALGIAAGVGFLIGLILARR